MASKFSDYVSNLEDEDHNINEFLYALTYDRCFYFVDRVYSLEEEVHCYIPEVDEGTITYYTFTFDELDQAKDLQLWGLHELNKEE